MRQPGAWLLGTFDGFYEIEVLVGVLGVQKVSFKLVQEGVWVLVSVAMGGHLEAASSRRMVMDGWPTAADINHRELPRQNLGS